MEASAVPREAPAGLSTFTPPHLLRLLPDARLVTLIRAGRPAAFEAAYDRHHRAILSFCRHVLGDPQEAEDAVQHTFLSAYNALISSQKPIHLRAWLFAIARNRCYSILRARREQPAADVEEPLTEGLAIQVQRRQDLRELVLDMRRLPSNQRAALVLAELDALSHEQIALALGVPREKVKALVFQARESLLASRVARETDCAEIREQLATQRGGALRRANLRRHLHECSGCREFRKQVEHQRSQFAALLPVAPTIALKETVLAGTAGGGAGISIAGGGFLASTAMKTGLLKGVLGVVLAGFGTAGTIVATTELHLHSARPAPREPRNLRQRAASAGQSAAAGSRSSASDRTVQVSRAGIQAQPGLAGAAGSVTRAPGRANTGAAAFHGRAVRGASFRRSPPKSMPARIHHGKAVLLGRTGATTPTPSRPAPATVPAPASPAHSGPVAGVGQPNIGSSAHGPGRRHDGGAQGRGDPHGQGPGSRPDHAPSIGVSEGPGPLSALTHSGRDAGSGPSSGGGGGPGDGSGRGAGDGSGAGNGGPPGAGIPGPGGGSPGDGGGGHGG
jgi:RNA polymerase sigma factor (sigma-70 family)